MIGAYSRRSGISVIMFAATFFLGCLFAISTAIEEAVKLGPVSENDEAGKLGKVIGIHLGTSHSSVGVYKSGHLEIIANEQGKRITPSWVAFNDNETLIGDAAKNQATFNTERTVFHVKRLIGRKFEDEEVQRAIKLLPYKIVNIDGKPYIKVVMKNGETKVVLLRSHTSSVST
ncbi:Mediator of RNA polymerase II transcription subunit 37a [Heracleum sosnowskyi]|uniref:Mediator of RNA polymerase II transcription subunit 37a n=1 Tax=Heracleum sosnowskyi TaxID=360622 RepID=A0AAD8GY42_9APIA|nr:Mediator of RNA polymerase II transcription subunit 37a [Heracleum sosnowskyi]